MTKHLELKSNKNVRHQNQIWYVAAIDSTKNHADWHIYNYYLVVVVAVIIIEQYGSRLYIPLLILEHQHANK